MDKRDRRVRYPVAVMTAVQVAGRAVDGHLQTDNTPHSEVDLRPSALVNRSITEEPDVRFQQINMLNQHIT